MQHRRPPQLELRTLASCLCCARFGEVTAVMQQMMMQIDVHRANAGARAAQ